MIGADAESARALHADLVALQPCPGVSAEISALCAQVTETVTDEGFPGGCVPVVDGTGGMQINVATSSMADWRRLKPVLVAFAGPTLTAFDGVPEPFDPADPVGARLAQAGPAVTAIVRLAPDPRLRLAALRSVLRARETLARAPELQRSAPVPTSWLLLRFQDLLNVGRRDAAAEVIERLRSELRLDALNLKFLEVQLLDVFGDWPAIVALPEFSSLTAARKTPAVAAILLEALYQVHIGALFDVGDQEGARQAFTTSVRPHLQAMAVTLEPAALRAGGWRLLGLEALTAPPGPERLAKLYERAAKLEWIAELLPPAAAATHETAATAPLDTARQALIQAEAGGSIDLLANAMTAIARLSPEELTALRNAAPFRAIVQTTEDSAVTIPPTSWTAWFERLSDPEFTNALDIARQGKDEWEISSATADPVAVQALVAALEKAQDDALAAERASQALPYIVAWLQRDEAFPRAALSPLYSALLTLFALGSTRGAATYQSSLILVEGLLAAGLTQKRYQDLIADIDEIAGDGFGLEMVYWALELVENFMSAATPDADAREAFLHRILARIAPLYARLTGLQRVAVTLLSSELGWSLPEAAAATAPAVDNGLASRLAGLRIGIYSLTESASRQAKAALEEIAPSVMVDTNADHGGSARLRALAENADLFVMTWLSAKHAATDFIREQRGAKPLIYVSGKGFSSILRDIEEYVTSARFGSNG